MYRVDDRCAHGVVVVLTQALVLRPSASGCRRNHHDSLRLPASNSCSSPKEDDMLNLLREEL